MMAEVYKMLVYLSVIISIVYFFIISLSTGKRNVRFLLLCSIVVFTNIGFAVLISTEDLAEAIMATKMTYLGGCFVPLIALRIGLKLWGIQIKKPLYYGCMIISMLVFLCAWTIGYSDIYYSDCYLDFSSGFTVMVKEYGPLHWLYTLHLSMYLIFALVVIGYILIHRKDFSMRTLVPYLMSWSAAGSGYFLEKVLKVTVYWEPLGLTIALTIFTFIFKKVSLFDMNYTVINVYDRVKDSGYVVFDKNYRYRAVNQKAKDMFPELGAVPLDSEAAMLRGTDFYEKFYYPLITTPDTFLDKVKCNKYYVTARVFNIGGDDIKHRKGYLFELSDESEEAGYEELLKSYRSRLEDEVRNKTMDLENTKNSIVTGIAEMVEARDRSTGEHIRRTSDVVRIFARRLIRTAYPIEIKLLHNVLIAAPMHDLGKIAVDDKILRKAGKFTEDEYAVMKTHPAKGAGIVRRVLLGVNDDELMQVAVNVARHHHEKWNGTGYPDGLKGEEIPVEARIMALADVFDALVSIRVYKDAYSYDEAFKIIEDSIGSHFDPILGQRFLESREELISLYEGYKEDGQNVR